jgi:hypothetical protein
LREKQTYRQQEDRHTWNGSVSHEDTSSFLPVVSGSESLTKVKEKVKRKVSRGRVALLLEDQESVFRVAVERGTGLPDWRNATW